MKRRYYRVPPEIKAQIKELYLQGKSIPDISLIVSVPVSTVYHLIQPFKQAQGIPKRTFTSSLLSLEQERAIVERYKDETAAQLAKDFNVKKSMIKSILHRYNALGIKRGSYSKKNYIPIKENSASTTRVSRSINEYEYGQQITIKDVTYINTSHDPKNPTWTQISAPKEASPVKAGFFKRLFGG